MSEEVDINVLMNTIHEQAKAISELNDEKEALIKEFLKIGDRIVIQIKLRYGSDAKGSEYLENLFKNEFEKLKILGLFD